MFPPERRLTPGGKASSRQLLCENQSTFFGTLLLLLLLTGTVHCSGEQVGFDSLLQAFCSLFLFSLFSDVIPSFNFSIVLLKFLSVSCCVVRVLSCCVTLSYLTYYFSSMINGPILICFLFSANGSLSITVSYSSRS